MGSKKHGFFRVCGHRPRPLLGQIFNMAKGVFKRLLSLPGFPFENTFTAADTTQSAYCFDFNACQAHAIWQGASTNKMLDNFNTSVSQSSSPSLLRPNMSIQASGVQTVGSGFTQGGTEHVQSRATKIFKISIPGKRFVKGGVLQYENGSSQPKFYDYHLAANLDFKRPGKRRIK